MKWLDRWFVRMSKRAWENSKKASEPVNTLAVSAPHLSSYNNFNLSIHRANNGGYAVEISSYDRIKDEHNRDLYVIGTEQDLCQELSSIITQHSLRY